MQRFLLFLFIFSTSLSIAQEESFALPLPLHQEWSLLQKANASNLPRKKYLLTPLQTDTLKAEESLELQWQRSHGITPTEVRGHILEMIQKESLPCTTRSLMHHGINQCFEIRRDVDNKAEYQLFYIASLSPYLVAIRYRHENLADFYTVRSQLLDSFSKLTFSHLLQKPESLTFSPEGVFLNEQEVPISESIQRVTLPHESFTLYLPSSWEVNRTDNRKSYYFNQTQAFITGSCGSATRFSLKLEQEFPSLTEMHAHLREMLALEDDLSPLHTLDGKEVFYFQQKLDDNKLRLRSYIPGIKEIYTLEITGPQKVIEDHLFSFERVLKHFVSPWGPSQD